jgi:MFS family permease
MWLSTYSTVQGIGQALGPVLAGYLIATGRFDLAFLASGLIGLAVLFIIAGWPELSPAGPARAPWQEFKRGVAEVGRDRLVIVTSGAQAAQFVLNGMLNAFLPLYGRDVLGLATSELGWMFGLQTVTTLAVRPVIGFCRIAPADDGSSSRASARAAPLCWCCRWQRTWRGRSRRS